MNIEGRLLTLERHNFGSRTVRIFQEQLDYPGYFSELTGGADSLRLFTQKDLDAVGKIFQIVKIIYNS